MCLQDAGMEKLPDISFLECLTGMPFGTCFLNFELPVFFPSPAKTDPHEGLSQALETLGWTCELWQGENEDDARIALEGALKDGPVLLGPLDMSFLSYDPNHKSKAGGDHFLVVLNIKDDMVELHDPQFYPYAVLPIGEMMRAWNATTIGYIDNTYTLRYSFQERKEVSREQLLKSAFKVAQMLQSDVREGPVVFTGAAAWLKALELIEPSPAPSFAGIMTHFALPIGARRSHDAMQFMTEVGNDELAKLYEEKAKLFGSAQYHAATQNWATVSNNFKSLAELEAELSEKVQV
jgi:hypothetical protein